MKKMIGALGMLAAMSAAPLSAQDAAETCSLLNGAAIVNDDGEYLGRISPPSDRESIFNEYGEYGNPYRSDSIWNEYGKNGSEYRQGSAFNPYTRNPPIIVKQGQAIGYLSVNKSLPSSVHPALVGIVCYDVTPPR